jgi:hypothetical protein
MVVEEKLLVDIRPETPGLTPKTPVPLTRDSGEAPGATTPQLLEGGPRTSSKTGVSGEAPGHHEPQRLEGGRVFWSTPGTFTGVSGLEPGTFVRSLRCGRLQMREGRRLRPPGRQKRSH